jgi:peptidyl-tRNA hydrolase
VKLYLVSRRDLEAGRRAAMFVHAQREFTERHEALDREWYATSNTVVLLEAENLEALSSLATRATREGIPVSCFHEPDLGGDLASIAIAPSGRRLVRGLPLAFR